MGYEYSTRNNIKVIKIIEKWKKEVKKRNIIKSLLKNN